MSRGRDPTARLLGAMAEVPAEVTARVSRIERVDDPSDTEESEVRFVQPYEATKAYLCPGCNRDIPAGMGHMVAIPPEAPDLRRHWHRGCWNNRKSRF